MLIQREALILSSPPQRGHSLIGWGWEGGHMTLPLPSADSVQVYPSLYVCIKWNSLASTRSGQWRPRLITLYDPKCWFVADFKGHWKHCLALLWTMAQVLLWDRCVPGYSNWRQDSPMRKKVKVRIINTLEYFDNLQPKNRKTLRGFDHDSGNHQWYRNGEYELVP